MFGRVYGLTSVILRYTNVFGPRQAPHGECGVCAVLTDLMLQGKQPSLFGFGEPIRDYVYVGDVARANLLALERGDNDTFNICSGTPTTVRQIFDALKELTGFRGDPVLKPLRPGEMEKSLCSYEKAARVLGWTPMVGLQAGLRETVHGHV
jgi:UDP-glucose 4-epimerase